MKNFRIGLLILLVLTPAALAQWQRFHGNSCNTGLYPGAQGRSGDYGILWTYPMKQNLFSSPAIADVDLDGLPEVIIGSGVDTLYALNGEDGSILWRYVSTSGLSYSSPVVGDIDGDLKPEVVCASYGSLRALEGETGQLVWQRVVIGGAGISPCLADLDGDGVLEVVHAGSNETAAFNGADGDTIWILDDYFCGVYGSAVAEDVFDDGSAEVIGFTSNPSASLSLINGEDGTILWTAAVPSSAGMVLTPASAFADLDSDGTSEIVGCSGSHYVYVLNALDGSLLWSQNVSSNIYASPVLMDIDGNDTLEVIVACLNTKKLNAYSCSGELIWTASVNYLPGSTPAAADIDGDGVIELIQVSTNGTYSSVQILDGATGEEEWSITISGSLSASAAIGDLDDDGFYDFTYCIDSSEICTMRSGLEGIEPDAGNSLGVSVYPNPCCGSATVSFFLAEPGNALVDIFDMAGRNVATLNNSFLNRGINSVQWNGTNENGGRISPGIYICRIQNGGITETERFCVMGAP